MISSERLNELVTEHIDADNYDTANALDELRWRRIHEHEPNKFFTGLLNALLITTLILACIYLLFFAPIGCIQ